METTKRKRTREEVRAAFKESLRRKKEWIEESNAFLERIQQQRLAEQIERITSGTGYNVTVTKCPDRAVIGHF